MSCKVMQKIHPPVSSEKSIWSSSRMDIQNSINNQECENGKALNEEQQKEH